MTYFPTFCAPQIMLSVVLLLVLDVLDIVKAEPSSQSNTLVQRGLNENNFFQLKLHWETGYDWPRNSLCAQCNGRDCTKGYIYLKNCQRSIPQQWWSETADGKMNAKTAPDMCATYSNPTRLDTKTCSADNTSDQLVEPSRALTSNGKFRLRASGGDCVSVQGVPRPNARLLLRSCDAAERRNAVHWVRVGLGTSPTSSPTAAPGTMSPTSSPSSYPTMSPTNSMSPTMSPTTSSRPTTSPTTSPTNSPSTSPTSSPTESPTSSPSNSPTSLPSESPTGSPTNVPTTSPTTSTSPTSSPSIFPTNLPSKSASASPSESPTSSPSIFPTNSPSTSPTSLPSESPTSLPSNSPTNSPSTSPTSSPSMSPTSSPTTSTSPTSLPSIFPTSSPSEFPTSSPSKSPTSSPTKSATPTLDTGFLDGDTFQFRLHWEPEYGWTEERTLCVQCLSNNCASGSLFLAECDANRSNQKWNYQGDPTKMFSARRPKACLSYYERDRVTIRDCQRVHNGWQGVEIRQDDPAGDRRNDRFRILSADGECLTITKRDGVDNPRNVYRLRFASCRNALNENLAYWTFGRFATPAPTAAPTAALTSSPVDRPTTEEDHVPPNPVPRDPRKGYFNYDLRDNRYGPNKWRNVDTSDHFLKELGTADGFGAWAGHLHKYDPVQNRCGWQPRTQSPKNVYGTTECRAWHEIRTRCGNYEINDDRHEKQILPHKLSVRMFRRRCVDLDDVRCKYPRPPAADHPNYIGETASLSDLLNYDIKIPGEHTVEGERFDAEVQMLNIHPDRKSPNQVTSTAVMIRATPDGFNREFQSIVDEFQNVYDSHKRACERNQREKWGGGRPRRGGKQTNTETGKRSRGLQQTRGKFDPYTKALMPGIYFYRYNGSMTEPPCLDLPWWIMSEPIIIGQGQLAQLKNILFTHVNEDCEPTSVHNAEQSVARPLFPLGTGDKDGVQHCTRRDFISDYDRGIGRGRQC